MASLRLALPANMEPHATTELGVMAAWSTLPCAVCAVAALSLRREPLRRGMNLHEGW